MVVAPCGMCARARPDGGECAGASGRLGRARRRSLALPARATGAGLAFGVAGLVRASVLVTHSRYIALGRLARPDRHVPPRAPPPARSWANGPPGHHGSPT